MKCVVILYLVAYQTLRLVLTTQEVIKKTWHLIYEKCSKMYMRLSTFRVHLYQRTKVATRIRLLHYTDDSENCEEHFVCFVYNNGKFHQKTLKLKLKREKCM